jgi:hypothetical protein
VGVVAHWGLALPARVQPTGERAPHGTPSAARLRASCQRRRARAASLQFKRPAASGWGRQRSRMRLPLPMVERRRSPLCGDVRARHARCALALHASDAATQSAAVRSPRDAKWPGRALALRACARAQRRARASVRSAHAC